MESVDSDANKTPTDRRHRQKLKQVVHRKTFQEKGIKRRGATFEE